MMQLHGPWQAVSVLLALYVLWLGWARFRSLHLGGKATFRRRRHVFLGRLAVSMIVVGALGGAVLVRLYWHEWLVTGLHGIMGGLVGFLFCLVWLLGQVMVSRPRKRTGLPLLHGGLGLAATLMALGQIATGYQVMKDFIWGL